MALLRFLEFLVLLSGLVLQRQLVNDQQLVSGGYEDAALQPRSEVKRGERYSGPRSWRLFLECVGADFGADGGPQDDVKGDEICF